MVQATVNQRVQIGVEAAPGVSVPATRLLKSISIEPSIQADVQVFRPQSQKFATAASLGREWTEASLSGQPTYDELTYVLASVLSYQAPVQITPPDGLAYRWTFSPAQVGSDVIQTYTIEFGSPTRAYRFGYAVVREFGLTVSRDSVEISGSMFGRAIEAATLTSSPSELPTVPIVRPRIDVYLDDTYTEIGTTKLTGVSSIEFSISDRYGMHFPIDSSLGGSYRDHVDLVPSATVQLNMEADEQGMALLSALRGGEKRFLRIRATGPQIESGTQYQFTLDMCAFVSEPQEFSDQDGVYEIGWQLTVAYDGDWGKALQAELINTLASL